MWPTHGRRSEMSQRAIVHTHTQGGIKAVVIAMGSHAENARLQEIACGVLYNLVINADNHPENQQRIKWTGAGEAVKRAISAPGASSVTKKKGQLLLDALKNV
jgi:hypothetical protein